MNNKLLSLRMPLVLMLASIVKTRMSRTRNLFRLSYKPKPYYCLITNQNSIPSLVTAESRTGVRPTLCDEKP